jgi:hypothetical protein
VSPVERLTPAEVALAERYTRVLEAVSRCAEQMERGDWFALRTWTDHLEDAACQLAQILAQTCRQISAGKPPPRPAAVRAGVVHLGRRYQAARLLHPAQPPRGGEPR